jgi:hypothetical protein
VVITGRVLPIGSRYTFETFVKGASNRSPTPPRCGGRDAGRSYNPLFIYGDAGLGKTHLLHAIGHYVTRTTPPRVRYVSTETFLNEFVDAIRTNTMAEFKRRYREIDVLLVDDIQFMEGKEGLQEEFFHTFNSSHQANKQIVLSSDRPPDAIPTLEDRLRSRFKWGLITDIQPPDLETRLAILRKKAERDRPGPARDARVHRHQHHRQHPRARGRLIRVTAYASLNRVPITSPSWPSSVSPTSSPTPAPPHHPREEILDETPKMFGFRSRRCGQEPPAAARHGPPDRDVRVPRAHRPVATRPSPASSAAATTPRSSTRSRRSSAHEGAKQIYDQVTELIQLREGMSTAPGRADGDAHVDEGVDDRARRWTTGRRPPNHIAVSAVRLWTTTPWRVDAADRPTCATTQSPQSTALLLLPLSKHHSTRRRATL